jgi:hypothetical protein
LGLWFSLFPCRFWQPAYEAQNEALDLYTEKYNLQDQDWRPEMFQQMEKAQ